ncbi:hypothetical protein CSIM01_02007 [Colletotrichum simmondsii]|uniref:Uncharacterized protein n=1 Tax=Colletotrichum simmondsii TaxID=703756 RepID=A0A135SGF6_9PEZI|nr:hypothetical protein CSIM01_02007 [Colletotrichum simmondsii]
MARKRRQWESHPPDGVNIELKVRKAGSAQLIGGVTYRFAAVRHRRAGKGPTPAPVPYQHGVCVVALYGPFTPASADLETVAPPKASPPFSHRRDLELVDSAEDAEGRLPPTKGRNSHGLSGATRRTGSARVHGRIWTEWARISNPATTMNGQAFRLLSLPQPSSLFMFDRQATTMTQKWPKTPDKFEPNRPGEEKTQAPLRHSNSRLSSAGTSKKPSRASHAGHDRDGAGTGPGQAAPGMGSRQRNDETALSSLDPTATAFCYCHCDLLYRGAVPVKRLETFWPSPFATCQFGDRRRFSTLQFLSCACRRANEKQK